jgi:cytochrome c553
MLRTLHLVLALLIATPAIAAAPFQDTIAQRVAACTSCHGKDGRAASDGYYPRIAGKTEGYLVNQLMNFRDGRRNYLLMNHLIEQFSDDYIREIAHYFATLDLPYAAPQPSGTDAATLERGRVLVTQGDTVRKLPACAACHGAALTGMNPATPGLLGLPRDYINAQLGAWQVDQRRAKAPDCMSQIARSLTRQDILALSSWLAAQPLPLNAHPAAPASSLPLNCGSTPAAASVRP